MSLKDCIEKAGRALSKQDRKFLMAELDQGKTDQQALDSLANVIRQEMLQIAKQVDEQGGTVLQGTAADRYYAQSIESQLAEDRKWSAWKPSYTSTGKVQGAPQWVNRDEDPKAALRKLERLLTNRIQEGLVGRFWYEDSARAVMNIVNNDLQEAERFIQLIAIYSPQANVQVNTQFAVKAWNQYKRNDPIDVKTGDQDAKASAVLYDNQPFDGRKTNSFYQNLMYELVKQNPKARSILSLDAELVDNLDKPATMDMWMFRAFEYDNEAAADDKGSGAYSFAENMTRRITAKLNKRLQEGEERWTPHQVQAAIWTAMKARFETDWVKVKTNRESLRKGHSFIPKSGKNKGKLVRKGGKHHERQHRKIWNKWARTVSVAEATQNADITAASFETFLDQMTETVTWEAMPSTALNLPINEASEEVKAAFHRDALRLVVNEDGVDQLAEILGVPLNYVRLSAGAYDGMVNENFLTHLVPEKEGGSFDTETVRAYARAIQYIYKQDAVPWFRADPRALTSKKAREDQKFRVVNVETGRTFRKFDTLAEAQKAAEQKGEKFAIRGGKYQRSTAFTFKEKLSPQKLDSVLESLIGAFGSDAGFTVTGPNEISVVNFRDDQTNVPEVSDEDFQQRLESIEDALQELGVVDATNFWSEGEYGHYQDWKADPEGSEILVQGGLAGRPDLQAWVRDRREAFDRLLETYSAGNLPDREIETRQTEYLAQSAFHATGESRTYDRLSTEYVGRGKGVGQYNYGWGLYFSDTREISDHYRKWLTEARHASPMHAFKINGQSMLEFNEELTDAERTIFAVFMDDYGDGLSRGILDLEPGDEFSDQFFGNLDEDFWMYPEEYGPWNQAAAETLMSKIQSMTFEPDSGALYEVSLLPAQDEYLLWDLGVEKQPAHIQEKITELTGRPIEYYQGIGFTGGDVYNMLSRKYGDDKTASLDLLAAGIKGVKYRDASNRDYGSQSYNYVIFDDQQVEIIERLMQSGMFYSALERGAKQLQKKGTGDQLLAQLKKMPGVKAEELEWLGIEDYLAGKETITRDEIVQFIQDGGVKVDEVTYGLDPRAMIEDIRIDLAQATADATFALAQEDLLGFDTAQDAMRAILQNDNWTVEHGVEDQGNFDAIKRWRAKSKDFEARRQQAKPAKYQQYTTPGGTDYREIVLTLPVVKPDNPRALLGGPPSVLTPREAAAAIGVMEGDFGDATEVLVYYPSRYYIEKWGDDYHVIAGADEILTASLEEAEAWLVNQLGSELEDADQREEFRNNHFDESNIIGHVRFNRREIDGKNTLFIEEIQSDWHQAGRRGGYRDPQAREKLGRQIEELDAEMRAIYQPYVSELMAPGPVVWEQVSTGEVKTTYRGNILADQSVIDELAQRFVDRLSELGIDKDVLDFAANYETLEFEDMPVDVWEELDEIVQDMGLDYMDIDQPTAEDQARWVAPHPLLEIEIVQYGPDVFQGRIGDDTTTGATLEATQVALGRQLNAKREHANSDVGIWQQLRDQKGPLVDAMSEEEQARLFDMIEARDEMFTQRESMQTGVPNAPFKKTWPLLMMKRMIRYAVDNGFDQVAWTTGDMQASRYGDRQGMIGFYDQMIPSMTKKYVKKMGADVGMVEFSPAVMTEAPRPRVAAPAMDPIIEQDNQVNIAIDELLNRALEAQQEGNDIIAESLEVAAAQINTTLGDIGLSQENMADAFFEGWNEYGPTEPATDARDRQLELIRDTIYTRFEEPISLNRLDAEEAAAEAEVAAMAEQATERPTDRPYFDVLAADRERFNQTSLEDGESVAWDLAYSRPHYDENDLIVVYRDEDENTEEGHYVAHSQDNEELIMGPYAEEDEAFMHIDNLLDPTAATDHELYEVVVPIVRSNELGETEVQTQALQYYQGQLQDSYSVQPWQPWEQSPWTELQQQPPGAEAPAEEAAPTSPWKRFGSIDALAEEYQQWLQERDLPQLSADEVLAGMTADNPNRPALENFIKIWEKVQSEEDNAAIGTDLQAAIERQRGEDHLYLWSEAQWAEGVDDNIYIYQIPIETEVEGEWMRGTLEVNVELDPDRDPPIEAPESEAFSIEDMFVGDYTPIADLGMEPSIPVPQGVTVIPQAPAAAVQELVGPTEPRVMRPAVMVHAFPVTDKMRETAMAGQALFQDVDPQTERGRYFPNVNDERVIQLTEASDLSSFLHESGHLFLDIQKVWARKYGLNENQAAMLKWLGVRRFEDLSVEHHEKWAETFEVYLREGKAPSLSLRRAFAAFARWLKRIYRTLSDPRLARAELKPEIREIFDRMLATEEEIAESYANPGHAQMFKSKDQAGMTDLQWEQYMWRAQRRKDTAEMNLDEKVLAQYKQQKSAEWAREKKPLIEEEKQRLSTQREYQLLGDLTVIKNDQGEVVQDNRMDWHKLKAAVGEIPQGKFIGKAVGGGVDPGIYAEAYGYPSVKAMYEDINTKPTLNKAADAAAESRMISRHGDILNDGTLEEEVREALINEDEAAMLMMELKATQKKEGFMADIVGPTQKINRAYLKSEAESLISSMTFKEIKPDKYYRQMIKAAEAAARGENPIQSKIQQLANHYLYKSALKAKQDIEKRRVKIKAVQDRNYSPQQVDQKYIEQMKMVAMMYDMRKKPKERMAYAEQVLDWYAGQIVPFDKQTGQGNPHSDLVNLELLDPNLIAALEYRMTHDNSLEGFELKGFDELTAEEVHGVTDMLDHLRYVGGEIMKAGAAEKAEIREAGIESILDNGGKNFKVRPDQPRPFDQPRLVWSSITSALPSLGNMVRKLDGFKEDGWAFRNILLPLNDAIATKFHMQEQMHDKLDQYMGNISTVGLSNSDAVSYRLESGQSRDFSSEEIFMIATYWGTASSRRAIMEGHELTEADVQKLMATLTPDQLRLVNSVWAMNESQWPALQKAAKAMLGTAPPKLKAMPFVVNGVQMTGGHMQLMYTGVKTELKDEQQRGMNTSNVVPMRAGSTHKRIGGGGKAVRLQVTNIVQSVEEKTHYIAFAEAGRALRSLVNNDEITDAIVQKHGEKFYKNFVHSIQGITSAQPAQETNDGLAALSRYMRGSATMMHLAYSVRNTVQQVGAVPIAAREVGEIRFMQASAALLERPREVVQLIETKSAFMKNRGQLVNREAREYLKKVMATSAGARRWETFKSFGFVMQTKTDMAIAYPTWYAKYNMGMEKHGDERRAILEADTAVGESVGSGADIHLGRIMQSNQNEFIKTLTIFGSWFNAYYQRLYRSSKGGTDYLNPQFLSDGVLLPIIVANFTQLLIGDWPDEDEEWYEFAGKNGLLFLAGTLPLVRDVGSLVQGFTPTSPLSAIIASPVRVWNEISSYKDDNQSSLKLTADVGRAAGQLIRMPGQGNVWRALDYYDSWLRGEEGEIFNPYQAFTEGATKQR